MAPVARQQCAHGRRGLPVAVHATPALPAKDIKRAERTQLGDTTATLNAPVKGLDSLEGLGGPRGAEIGQGQRDVRPRRRRAATS